MEWTRLLNDFDREILEGLGVDPWYLPTDRNPISEAMTDGDFVRRFQDVKGFGKASVSRLASICQMVVYDRQRGPDGDGKRKGLRRQWYAWFKTRFAQPFSRQLSEEGDGKESEGFDGRAWSGRLSSVYAKLVDDEGVTYHDLWVDDASRMMERLYSSLFRGLNLVIAVEKDSLFADFVPAGKALGARTVVSGKGKQSKAATEKMLREHFSWSSWNDPFEENPLIVLHITDHDMDGQSVIGPTFGEQCRRYTTNVLEARVGVKPDQVEDWESDWYEVKVNNGGYVKWAEREGLYRSTCTVCGRQDLVQGVGPHSCQCGNDVILTVKVGKEIIDQPYGFEVEALPTRRYYRLLVDALLEVLDFEYIVERLRDECTADPYKVTETIVNEVLEENEDYKRLQEEVERLQEVMERFKRQVEGYVQPIAEDHQGDFRDEEDDPEEESLRGHVEEATDWASPWRPFSTEVRTEKLIEWIHETETERLDEYKDMIID